MTLRTVEVPPCMAAISANLAAGLNVPHAGRFAFGSFALMAGESAEDVARQFSRTPNYSEEKTRKIVEQMVERGYTSPNCTKMKADKLCVNPEPLCSSITNPISFLRARRGEHVGQIVKAEGPTGPLQLCVVVCQCSWRSRPVPAAVKESVGASHFWSIAPKDCDAHAEVSYEVVA